MFEGYLEEEENDKKEEKDDKKEEKKSWYCLKNLQLTSVNPIIYLSWENKCVINE